MKSNFLLCGPNLMMTAAAGKALSLISPDCFISRAQGRSIGRVSCFFGKHKSTPGADRFKTSG